MKKLKEGTDNAINFSNNECGAIILLHIHYLISEKLSGTQHFCNFGSSRVIVSIH